MGRVLTVDPCEIILIALRHILEEDLSYEVVGERTDIASLCQDVESLTPDLVICETMFDQHSCFRVMANLTKAYPNLKVLYLTSYEQTAHLSMARHCGSYGLIYKRQPLANIATCIASVVAGNSIFSEQAKNANHVQRPPRLSCREEEVVCAIAQGMRLREIASHLRVSHKTVEAHKANAMKKLDVHSQVALIRWAVAEGLILP